MRKPKTYRQQTMETCGPCCILMALTAFGREPRDMGRDRYARREADLYKSFRCTDFMGMTGAAVAHVLARYGLRVTLLHESEQLIENRGGYFPQGMYNALLAEHMHRIGQGGFSVEAGIALDTDRIRAELAADRMTIVQCFIPGDADGIHDHVLHWILVYGWDGSVFRACDPLSGRIALTDRELGAMMITPAGASAIAVGEHGAM
ncbi:MAG: hypothetical protein J6K32_06590 [Clostridia bacterium]|nr:hypothetical protein [Clostridia bacterium]